MTMEQSPTEEKTVTTATPEVQTPTEAEQLKALQSQLAESTKKLEDLKRIEDGYKGLQRTLNQRNEELRKAADLRTEIEGLKETQKIFAAVLAEKNVEDTENIPQGRKTDLLKQFDELEKRQKEQARQAEIKRQAEEYNQKADEVWNEAKSLGLPENDDNLLDIEDYLKAGNLKRAQARISKLKVKEPVKTETPKETEEQRIERLVQERLKQSGLLKTDTVVPAGRALTPQEALKRYNAGEITEQEAIRAGARLI